MIGGEIIMSGKYEVRYYIKGLQVNATNETRNGALYSSMYTNSWFKFIKFRLTERVIYYKVYKI